MSQPIGLIKSLKFFAISILTVVSVSACSGSGDDVLYYVALGDSLSVGVQPDSSGVSQETDQGYVDLVYASLLQQFPNLQLIKLGCPSETTVTMINGGLCTDYEFGSQLDDATEFLVENLDKILLVTIDIGANDVLTGGCLDLPPADQPACFQSLFFSIGQNLSLISNALFAAADGKYPTIGMNFYNTFLAAWLTPPPGQEIAMATAVLQGRFNTEVLGAVYASVGFPVADVASAFQSDNFTDMVQLPPPAPPIMVPINVALICQFTYMCAPAPIGPNVHATPAGYQTIADVFLAVFNSL